MTRNKFFKAIICSVTATIMVLSTHILFTSYWTTSIIEYLTGSSYPEPDKYPFIIILAAYATAFIVVGLNVFLYYHAQHLIPSKNRLLKVIIIAAINLEVKGQLIRQPIMDILVSYTTGVLHNTFWIIIIRQIEPWSCSLFLALCLVYLCPQKYN